MKKNCENKSKSIYDRKRIKEKKGYMSNTKAMVICLIVGLTKKIQYSDYIKMIEYFLRPYKLFDGDSSVKLDLSNYTTKTNLKEAAGLVMSNLAAKSDLARLKAGVEKTEVNKLQTVPGDLSNLSNVASNDVVKKRCMIN